VPIEPGTKLGQYEVQEFIGQGAMGTVYRAYHAQLERTGAVKVMQAISPDKDAVSRFRHEAQAIARMRHPNVLNVFDFGEFEGTPYMIVEYVPGGSLADRLTLGPLDRSTALRFLRGIGAGLDYAHSQGIVHRDVKPANVLLERDETPVLADFGLAKLLQGSSVKSMTGVTTGTPAYIAPEQVSGHEVGPAADRYSLATIAYEMLTGSIPFEGEGVLELLYAHVHRDPALPSSLKADLNESVDAVIMRGLAKDPRARWATCEAFVTALAAALGKKAPSSVERTIAMSPPPERFDSRPLFAPPPSTIPSPVWPAGGDLSARREWRMRRFMIAAIAILALAAIIAGILGFLLRGSPNPTVGLSSSTVHAGDSLTVTASHLPANQAGEIHMLSVLHTFPFSADGAGNVSAVIAVPVDTEVGDHTLSICWAGTCHSPTTIVVTAPVALPSPSPTATPPSITLSASTVRIGGQLTVSGHNFDPSKRATVLLYQGSTPRTLVSSPVGVAGDGTFVVRVRIPSSASPGGAEIVACIYSGVAVQPTSSQCGARAVLIAR
jgi:serine/threonine protein kinase